jgi:hypothetical protein
MTANMQLSTVREPEKRAQRLGHKCQSPGRAVLLVPASLIGLFAIACFAEIGNGKGKPNTTGSQSANAIVFHIYNDVSSSNNHYRPTGKMGDCGDVRVDEAWDKNPHNPQQTPRATCIRIEYEAKGKGPNTCDYPAPCKWAGVYWQEPPNNWGKDLQLKGRGFDLSRYNRLLFWARADKSCTVEFKIGGIDGPAGDSLRSPRGIIGRLDDKWQELEISLDGVKANELVHIIGGFCFAATWDANPQGAIFYLDDIRLERR